MVQNLCSMLAGGMCSCYAMMNGLTVCSCNFTMGMCKCEMTDKGICVTCTSGDQKFFVAWGFVEVLPERVTILAETALRPDEIDVAEARQELREGDKLWHEAGDDGEKYDEANAITRRAEEKIASAEGKST